MILRPRLFASASLITASKLFTRTMSTSTIPTPSFSSNTSPEKGLADLTPLLTSNGGKWKLIETGKGIERSFKFKGFKSCWEFMTQISQKCVKEKHHPEWSNVYNTTFIRWTTHSPPGLSEKDILMARFCDEVAGACGEVEAEVKEEDMKGRELVDRVGEEAGDCCVPKKKI